MRPVRVAVNLLAACCYGRLIYTVSVSALDELDRIVIVLVLIYMILRSLADALETAVKA